MVHFRPGQRPEPGRPADHPVHPPAGGELLADGRLHPALPRAGPGLLGDRRGRPSPMADLGPDGDPRRAGPVDLGRPDGPGRRRAARRWSTGSTAATSTGSTCSCSSTWRSWGRPTPRWRWWPSLLHETLLAANPVTVLRSIARLGWDYLGPCVVTGLAIAARPGGLVARPAPLAERRGGRLRALGLLGLHALPGHGDLPGPGDDLLPARRRPWAGSGPPAGLIRRSRVAGGPVDA